MALKRYILCTIDQDNNPQKTGYIFTGKDFLSAAKKAYRNFKHLDYISLMDEDTNHVEIYNTSNFFSEKKSFKRDRYEK